MNRKKKTNNNRVKTVLARMTCLLTAGILTAAGSASGVLAADQTSVNRFLPVSAKERKDTGDMPYEIGADWGDDYTNYQKYTYDETSKTLTMEGDASNSFVALLNDRTIADYPQVTSLSGEAALIYAYAPAILDGTVEHIVNSGQGFLLTDDFEVEEHRLVSVNEVMENVLGNEYLYQYLYNYDEAGNLTGYGIYQTDGEDSSYLTGEYTIFYENGQPGGYSVWRGEEASGQGTYELDEAGRLIHSKVTGDVDTDQVSDFLYDEQGRLSEISVVNGISGSTTEEKIRYDEGGNISLYVEEGSDWRLETHYSYAEAGGGQEMTDADEPADFRIEYDSDHSICRYEDTGETLVMSGYRLPVFIGGNASMDSANERVQEIKEMVLADKENLESSADAQRRSMSDPSSFYPFCNVASTDTIYDDGRFLSMAIGHYLYSGGFHGFTETDYMNIDRETGTRLRLDDVIGIGEMEFEALLADRIQSEAADIITAPLHDITGTRNLRDYSFYFAENGLHIQFGEYEVGSYSSGTPDIVIPYGDLNLQIPLQPENSAKSYNEGYYYIFDETEESLLEKTGENAADSGEDMTDEGPVYSSVEEIERVFIPWDEAGLEDHPIVFADPNAEYKVRLLLDRQEGDILLSDLWEVKDLDLTPADGDHLITDIGFVSELKNLTVLNLNYNSIIDLSPVTSLSELEGLFFNANLVSDLRPLTVLKKLNRIDMSNNPVSDFSPLRKMTALTVVHSYGNGITDAAFDGYISCVEDLPLLVKLDVGANAISDFAPLSRMQQISELSIWDGGIDDAGLARLVGVISQLPKLKKLSLVRNRITDVTPLAGLVNLETLILSENAISDLSPLAQLNADITAENMSEAPAEPAASSGTEYAAFADIVSIWNASFQAALRQEDRSAYYDAGIIAEGYVVENIVNSFIYNGEDPGTVTFSLIDLNEDGTDELLIGICRTDSYTGSTNHSIHDIYAWDAAEGTYRRITPVYLVLYMLGDKTVMSRTGKGSSGWDFYRYTGGPEMDWYDGYENYYGEGDTERNWYRQGERVTADDFNQAVLSHGMLSYQAYPVTEENLAALAAGDPAGFSGAIGCTEEFEPYE